MAYTIYTGNTSAPTGAGGITYSVTGAGGMGNPGHTHAITNGGILTGGPSVATTINTYTVNPAVNIHSNGIDLNSGADIKLGNVSLRETLETLQERLAILVPDPEKLEKYEALKQAYDHYKLLEALCNEEGNK